MLFRSDELLAIYENGRPLPSSILALTIQGEDVEESGLVWEVADADCWTYPLAGSLTLQPWRSKPTGQLQVSMHPTQGRPAAPADPRHVLAKVIDALKADGTDGTDSTQNQGKDSSNVDSSLMLPALSGSGVTVTLDDSPLWENAVNNNGTTANINDYVIHQQDVESVVNALWAGGADALMIMDQRVLFNSAVICSGNVLSLHGKKYSPPFTISAIGDPQRLRAALNDSEAITILKQYVTAFGIGYKVENAEGLQFPATAALLQQLKYATVDTSKTTDEEQTQQ